MTDPARGPSARRDELIERAYGYALSNGLADLSLRPLAAAVGSSPGVLMFLFGSKDGLIRALLGRARTDEIRLLDRLRERPGEVDLPSVVRLTWEWLTSEPHRPLLNVWLQAYARSLTEPDGPWAGFARQTVEDWLSVLDGAQPHSREDPAGRTAERTLTLAVLRGALLDLLATDDVDRATAAVERYLRQSTGAGHDHADSGITAIPSRRRRPTRG